MKNEPLLAWQWRNYPDNHRDPGNLAIHVATWPLFVGGLAAAIAAIPTGMLWLLAAGPAAMVVAIGLQRRGHRREAVAAAPFRGPVDVVKRLIAEQLITLPRYIASGAFRRHIGSTTRSAG